MTQARNLSRLLNKKLQTYKFTATSGQTSFADSDDGGNILSYTPDNMLVTYNGVVLENGSEYTATNGTSVVLDTGADSAAEVNVYAFESVSLGGYLASDKGIDDNASSTALTIDASRNVLIDTTSTTIVGSGGLAAKPQGAGVRLDISNSGGSVMLLDRRTNDGEIITFYQDGTTAGNIKIAQDRLAITDNAYGGIALANGGNSLLPVTNSGVPTDNHMDMGNAVIKWKDIYLSGGIQFDARSNKLDDYEEGTWTPTITGGSGGTMGTATADGSYTKVGRVVTVNGNVNVTSTNGASGTVQINSLPFVVASTIGSTSIQANGSIAFYDNFSTAVNSLTLDAISGGNYGRMSGLTSSTQTASSLISVAQMGASNTNFRFTLTYFTT